MYQNLSHEKLKVYQKTISFISESENILLKIPDSISIKKHLIRASESIAHNIAEGNGRFLVNDRNQFFDVAYGSALECAACLDICSVKEILLLKLIDQGKNKLSEIVRMIFGLRKSQQNCKEESSDYNIKKKNKFIFSHEKLNVYQLALEFVGWSFVLQKKNSVPLRYLNQLDKFSTGIVLNIAEGNGKFSVYDHSRFLNIAYSSSLKSASCLDIIVARKYINNKEIIKGKQMLERIISMLIAMRNKLRKSQRSK